jgi:hypothetical protein
MLSEYLITTENSVENLEFGMAQDVNVLVMDALYLENATINILNNIKRTIYYP